MGKLFLLDGHLFLKKEISMGFSPSSLPLPEIAPETLDTLAGVSSARTFLNGMPVLQKVKRVIRRNFSGYLFLLPALLIFGLFVWYPIILGFIMSFQSVDLITPATWAGWANFRAVFSDPLFAIAWRNTLE